MLRLAPDDPARSPEPCPWCARLEALRPRLCWPRPVFARWTRADASAATPKRGLMKSVYAPHGPTGSRSGQPVIENNPASAAP